MKKYPRTIIYSTLAFLLFVAIISSSKSIEHPPNIIIVMTDDQGYGDLGYNGNQVIKTKNLDQFASESINFTNYHAGTTCSPTRAGFITGRNCLRNGVWHTNAGCSLLNQDEVTIADIFAEAGYETGMFGKWHLGDNYSFLPEQRGFKETFYHKGGGIGQTPDYWNNNYQDDVYFRNGEPEKTNGYCTDVFFEEAISFINKNRKKPFLCFLSLNAPHSPFNVPKEYYEIYENENDLLESQKRFYGMITNIDDNFGRLHKQVENLGILDNTIIIFTTDNGTSNGYKYSRKDKKWLGFNAGMRGTKTSEYDGGHRVPFIIKWKKGKLIGGQNYSGLSAHVDLLPSLLSLAKITFNSTKKIDGTDLSKYILNQKEVDRMLVIDTQRNLWPEKGKQSCVMYGNWRLVNGSELYNIEEDPGQKNNIINENEDVSKKMQKFYDDWWEDVSKEFKYSYIDIMPNISNTITAHDVQVSSITAWDQSVIRGGSPYELGKFYVNFKKSGQYKLTLRRWPKESGLNLRDSINDYIPAAKNWDQQLYGKSMRISSAFIKIGDKEYKLNKSDELNNYYIKTNISSGKTSIEPGFILENGENSIAFYTDIDFLF
tara:strand:- start:1999 stop:3798 length:1800 start_codon:yes stop_codon:yes gene_type:complete